MPATVAPETRARIRSLFPALSGEVAFLENAGGSQVPRTVIDRMARYLSESYVQLGAGYPRSLQATATVEEAHGFVNLLMNGEDGHVILGPSTSALLRMIADCYADILEPDMEIILAETGHEANLGPWKRLERAGAVLRWWRMNPETLALDLGELDGLLNERTALVCLPHVSNLLGDIVDLEAVTAAAHRVGARVVADGVAYAPHRAVDVRRWDVDWYVYSTYKVYGPHMAALYGTREALDELSGPNHFFIPPDAIPYKFELGGASHEGCAAILGFGDYLNQLLERPVGTDLDRAAVERAFALMTACELPLQERLVGYLRGKPGVRIIGPHATGTSRVGTVSFVHEKRSSREITARVDESGVAIRHGHMYAYHLCEALGLDVEDGVVRVSFVHYNTPEEIERLIQVLEEVL